MADFNVTVRDKNGNILTDEQLVDKVIDCDGFYILWDVIGKRIENDRAFSTCNVG